MKISSGTILAAICLGLPSFAPVALAKKRKVKNFSRRTEDGNIENNDEESSSERGEGRRLQMQETRIKTVIAGNDIVVTNPGFAGWAQERDAPGRPSITTPGQDCTFHDGSNPCRNGHFCFGGNTPTSAEQYESNQCVPCPAMEFRVMSTCDEDFITGTRNALTTDERRALNLECKEKCYFDLQNYWDFDAPNVLMGSVRFTDGGAYRPKDVIQRRRSAPGDMNFAKNRNNFYTQQPVRFPGARSNFFINGECSTTSSTKTKVLQQSCFYNLCMGNGGFNCVNFYIGGPYNYDQFAVVQNPENGEYYPELAPIVEGFVLGGTGSFAGIKGTVKMQQQSGQTPALNGRQSGLEVQLFTFKTYPKIPTPPGPELAVSNVADESGQVAADTASD